MSDIRVIEERSGWSVIIGLIFICIFFASLLTLRDMPGIPEFVTVGLNGQISIPVRGLIYLLAAPSLYVASLWGDKSMVMSMAFLFLGLGISLIFRKRITSIIRGRGEP